MSSAQAINTSKNGQHTHILSHAVKVPGLIFLSGQTPVDKTGVVVEGGIQEHTAQCIKNLGNVLEEAGSSWEKVVKVNVYLKNMDDFAAMNEVYSKASIFLGIRQTDDLPVVITRSAPSQSQTGPDLHSGSQAAL
ncbi:hypothetical protein FRC10_001902 [Ceratobasidium sp. 414]|nr:hypothetical protein FRC10_001902 [Ceratobasidium sp. 414]